LRKRRKNKNDLKINLLCVRQHCYANSIIQFPSFIVFAGKEQRHTPDSPEGAVGM
jgi:hypothetical protein